MRNSCEENAERRRKNCTQCPSSSEIGDKREYDKVAKKSAQEVEKFPIDFANKGTELKQA